MTTQIKVCFDLSSGRFRFAIELDGMNELIRVKTKQNKQLDFIHENIGITEKAKGNSADKLLFHR